MRTRHAIALVAAAALQAPVHARGDVLDVSSTTLLSAQPVWREGTTYKLVPVYEFASVTAHDVKNPLSEDLELVLSIWGGANLADKPWWNGYVNSGALSGDLNLAYVRLGWAHRAVVLSLGRLNVVSGVARMTQLDGANLQLRLPAGFGIQAYAGSPVAARFSYRGGPYDANPITGDFATGGRISWLLPGVLDLGTSIAWVEDHGAPSRQDVGADLRLTLGAFTVLGNVDYSLYGEQLAEGAGSVLWQLSRVLGVSVDYLYTVPSLFLPADSILSVVSDAYQNNIGATLHFAFGPAWTVDATYTEVFTPEGQRNTDAAGNPLPGSENVSWAASAGTRTGARAAWRPSKGSSIGAEVWYLDVPSNTYLQARLFGSYQVKRFTGTLDLQNYYFQTKVNGQNEDFVGTITLGYQLGQGWSTLLSGSAGVTPYFSNFASGMVKIAYNQTYVSREVR